MKAFEKLLYILIGIFLKIFADGLIMAAFAERGYHAVGGEWLLIVVGGVGLLGCGYKLRDWQFKESRKRVAKRKAEHECCHEWLQEERKEE